MTINKLKVLRTTKIWATTINVLAAIVIFNILIGFLKLGFDTTANKAHSLSPATKEIVSKLNDIVTIKAYVSNNLPPQLAPIKTNLKNILYQYERINKGNIKVIWADPSKDSDAEKEAISLGITPLQFSSLQKDQFQVTQGYLGLAIFFANQKQIIPALQEIGNLEYDLTATFKKFQQDKTPTIAFSSGLGETEQAKISEINTLLEKNYQITTLDLSEDKIKFDDKIDTLIIVGPKTKFSSKTKFVLDQLLMNQKGVLLLSGKINVSDELVTTINENGLDDFLTHFGIKLDKSLVVDQSAALANFRSQYGTFLVSYPFWVMTRQENANHNLPPTAGSESIVLPWTSPLELSNDAKPLWQSTPTAMNLTDYTNVSPTRKLEFTKDKEKQFILAAIQTNKTESFFKDKRPNDFEKLGVSSFKENTTTTKLVVVGNANFIENQIVTSYPENAQFFLNLVDYISADAKLISIRSKTIYSRPLRLVSEDEKQTVKITNLISGPILILLVSATVYWQRKKKISFYQMNCHDQT